jgi:thioredoxin-like negative regulator of GroEL
MVSPASVPATDLVPGDPVAAVVFDAQSVSTEQITGESSAAQALPSPELAVAELAGPAPSRTGAVRRRRKKAAEAPPLEAMAGVSAGVLSEIERCRQQLEVKPKDDDARLSLARAYRDAAQIKLALQEYDTLVHSKTKRTAEVVADMEGLVASRPDNLEAHELLADAYTKNGQLQQALQRYRWVLERMRQPS